MSNGRDSRSTEDAIGRRAVEGPVLPYAKAFLVQFSAETDGRLERVAGRVEHLQSGRRSRFASMEDLLVRIVAMLGGRLNASGKRGGQDKADRSRGRGRRTRIEPGAGEAPPWP